MRNLRLKVCGLRDNISEVAALRPDYLGVIFYKKSPRFVEDDFEMPDLDESTKKVGVFVNESLGKIKQLVKQYKLDFVQLHGNESVSYCDQLMSDGTGIIKAFQMDEDFDFEMLKSYDAVVDYFLFDTKTIGYGGSGKSFKWEILKKYSMEKEYFLSGGIGLDNIDDLRKIDLNMVHALDVNSRFEVSPGLKDIELLQELFDIIR